MPNPTPHVPQGHAAAHHPGDPAPRSCCRSRSSIDDFIITYFVSGPSTTTFPVRIFGQSRTATPPQINVLASMILFGSIIVSWSTATLLGQRRQAARQARA